MLAVLVSTCKHLSQQGGFQSDRIVKWACWRWPIALVRGVCAVGTPFDILGGCGADRGGGRLDGSARGLGVVLAAWGRGGGARGLGAWRWCSRLGGLLGVRQSWLRLAQSGGWFPKNVARNFHVNLSNFELASLELQRFQALLKVQAIELRATFGVARGLGEARWLGAARRLGGSAARLALDDVDGQAALRGLLVLREHVVAGLAHRLDDDVQAHRVPAVAP